MIEGRVINTSRIRLLILFVVLAALLYVYYTRPRFLDAPAPAPSAGARDIFRKLSIEKPKKDTSAPDFTLVDLAGRRISLKQLEGKVVFLNFWATWCGPCREEMPMMEALHREYKDQGLAVVAVNFREDKESVRRFFDELGLTFQALLDPKGEVSDRYGAFSLPLTYLIDRHGRFVGKAIGIRPWDSADAKALIEDLLEQKPKPQTETSAVDLPDPHG
ncbi:MAG TPA: redoxin domain-containing protein [Candidatus Binatia bacterium]|nr:redoxin domain-containing protein [Candidatus Binatia bacterium]